MNVSMYIAFIAIVFGGDENNGCTAFDKMIVPDSYIAYHARFKPTACIVCYQDATHLHSEESVLLYQNFTSGSY